MRPDYREMMEDASRARLSEQQSWTFPRVAAELEAAYEQGRADAMERLPELIRQALREEREVNRYKP